MLSYVVYRLVRLFYALHVWSSLLLHTVTLSLPSYRTYLRLATESQMDCYGKLRTWRSFATFTCC